MGGSGVFYMIPVRIGPGVLLKSDKAATKKLRAIYDMVVRVRIEDFSKNLSKRV